LEVGVATVEMTFMRSKMGGNESYFMVSSISYSSIKSTDNCTADKGETSCCSAFIG
jgi:hypothetical protein